MSENMINTLNEFWDKASREGLKIIQLDKEIQLTPQLFIDETYLDMLIELAKKEEDNILFVLVDKSTFERQRKIKVKVYVIFKQVLLGATIYVSDP